jgi:hypothetical protein
LFRVATLNVNGIRSALTKGLQPWIRRTDPDVLCLQEVKAHEADIPEAMRAPDCAARPLSLRTEEGLQRHRAVCEEEAAPRCVRLRRAGVR